MTVGERLREVRGKLTLKEFADPLEVTPSTISTIENDRSGLSVELAVKIAKTYNVSLDWLLMGEEKPSVKEEPAEGYVTMSKDELIALYQQLNENQKKVVDLQQQALRQKDEIIEKEKRFSKELKNELTSKNTD